MKVEVLGESYEIIIANEQTEPRLNGFDGFTDTSVRKIVVEDFKSDEKSKEDLKAYQKQVLRHELIHAFLTESGLDCCSDWARNEEMVDFFAIQFPKMLKAFKEVDCL